MFPLSPAIQEFAWGSREVLPEFLGFEATGDRFAEAWWGAHPHAPAVAHLPERDVALTDLIAMDPVAMLGAPIAARFDGELPFLLKMLAIDKPLSIQVHPDHQRAEDGYAREDAAGVPLDSPDRVYRDRRHKPEMVVAVTPMRVLVGFRPVVSTLADVEALDHPDAKHLADALGEPDTERAVAEYVRLALTSVDAPGLVEAVVAAAERSGAKASLRAAADAAAHFPGDAGVLVALAMNVLELAPGEAAFTPAGTVHSYQSGVGVEVMANSDNVIRAGLTSKHLEIAELLDCAETRPRQPRRPDMERDEAATLLWPDASEFLLTLVEPGPADFIAHPRIVLALEGSARVETAAGGAATIERGGAVFVPFSDGDMKVTTDGSAAVAGVPLTDDDSRLGREP